MRVASRIPGRLALCAALLVFGFPAYAQQTGGTVPYPHAASGNSQIGGAWNGDCPERQELREERERIRAEHDDLDAEHDRLKARCMDARGQERSECNDEKNVLHARMDALHERMRILHDKAAADTGCHHSKESGHNTPWPSRDGQTNGSTGGSTGVPASGSNHQ